jgi:hypothetical protein
MRLNIHGMLALAAGVALGVGAVPGVLAATPGARVAAAGGTDPCKLLTQAEASAVMGVAVGPGERTVPAPGHPRCRFFTAAHDELAVDVDDPALFDSYTHLGAKSVSGLGDKALWSHDEYGSRLVIAKGNEMIELVLPRTITMMTPAVQKAGRLIASRM